MRQPRKLKPGAIYHVTATINKFDNIFDEHDIKDMFLQVINEANIKYKFELTNFCIVRNHIEFILKPLKESLSKIMQWILSVFAMRYNHKHHINGHVWYDRFKSRIIETVEEIETSFKSISQKPIEEKLAKKASEYEYCGISLIIKGIFDLIKKPPQNLLELAFNY
ncbi:MAG: hypothetical protein A2086_07050 [Spirochaetes bacterium GWD1_27_9]|nr:MAG: hypothetical protein A2Z98_02045 [Spirochaetes bacterium GWB1_27_13]OHD22625.1 MAG: hypothetical protein A2Y34_13370 [Spirochaetes bacterium GWC1_27_15]OHD34345.1 MAG: hypothetical protein A2086_07050 [Spirochaetes bacterium GWD1_27_9]